MSDEYKQHYHNRSFFWPIMLIGVGVIWLLYNFNLIPAENLWMLLRLWPVLIIVAGLDIMLSRRLALIGALLGLLVIAGAVYILLFGQDLGITTPQQPKSERFAVDLGETAAVDFDLDLSIQETILHALSGSDQLVLAEIGHAGTVNFRVTGEEMKEITLAQVGVEAWYDLILPEMTSDALLWDIGLSPEVPFDLSVDAGTGRSELDLSGVQLERFRYDGGTGASTILLPAAAEAYEAHIESGAGAVHVVLPAESSLTVWLDSGSGKVVFDVPADAAVRVDVHEGGSGNLQAPAWLTKISGAMDRDEGIYQSAGYEEAKYQLLIIIEDIGSGNIVIE